MAGPEWIDEALSRDLPVLRNPGEGQHLEFMARYPGNGHELSREIAAFASSNPGAILIGVADDGSLAGLDDIDTPGGRDRLLARIHDFTLKLRVRRLVVLRIILTLPLCRELTPTGDNTPNSFSRPIANIISCSPLRHRKPKC